MSKVKSHSVGATLPADTDIKQVRWYVAAAGQAGFVDSINADPDALPFTPVPVAAGDTKSVLKLVGLSGSYQFANVVEDMGGNLGDAFQDPAWVSVPLDTVAPGMCSAGFVD